MPLDHYVTLGRSGLRVSPFCLGAMTFGEDLGWGSSVDESQRIIDRFIELGGNFYRYRELLHKSHSEKIIGDHVGRHSARRDRLVIATKFSGNLYPGDPNGGGSGRKSIIAACENSLRRLQTEYIDLYWLHNWDVHTPIDETLAALEDLVRAGKVRYLGVSDTPAWKIAEANVHRALPWLVRVHWAADRVLPARADRRTGTRADGSRVRPRHHAVVAPQERRCSAANTRDTTPGRLRQTAASSPTPFSPRRPTQSSTSWTSSPRRTRARRTHRSGLGSGAAWRDLGRLSARDDSHSWRTT